MNFNGFYQPTMGRHGLIDSERLMNKSFVGSTDRDHNHFLSSCLDITCPIHKAQGWNERYSPLHGFNHFGFGDRYVPSQGFSTPRTLNEGYLSTHGLDPIHSADRYVPSYGLNSVHGLSDRYLPYHGLNSMYDLGDRYYPYQGLNSIYGVGDRFIPSYGINAIHGLGDRFAPAYNLNSIHGFADRFTPSYGLNQMSGFGDRFMPFHGSNGVRSFEDQVSPSYSSANVSHFDRFMPSYSPSIVRDIKERNSMGLISENGIGMEDRLDYNQSNLRSEQRIHEPATYLIEENDCTVVQLELFGVNEKDFRVMTIGNNLIIEGFKEVNVINAQKSKTAQQAKLYFMGPVWHGAFKRVITLDYILESSAVSASFSNGVLTLTVKKPQSHKAEFVKVVSK